MLASHKHSIFLMTSHKKAFWETAVKHINELTSIEFLLVMTAKAKTLWEVYASSLPDKTKAIYVNGEYLKKENIPPIITSARDSIENLFFLCVHKKHENLSRLYYDNVFEIGEVLGQKNCWGLLPDGNLVGYSIPKNRPAFDERFMKLKNIHKDKRAFVLGNGPSLSNIPINRLKDEITYCSNRIYISFQKWGVHFKYYAIQNPISIDNWKNELAALPKHMIKFFPEAYRVSFNSKNSFFLKFTFPKSEAENAFTDEPRNFIYGKSVSYLLLQLAVFMGCDPIIPIGMDHEWIPQRDKADGTVYCKRNYHFHPDYEVGLKKQIFPNQYMMTMDYERVRIWAAKHGRTILNASPGTRLNVFPTIDFNSLPF